jgi:DNA-binding MarR family transcriptional regulator
MKGRLSMQVTASLELTYELFQSMKQIPRPKMIRGSFAGLSRSEYELLAMLAMSFADEKRPLSVSEISNLLQITPAGVTHLINPLEESGFIVRLPDPDDRRIVLIGLTQKGTAVAEALLLEVQETLIGLITYLGEEDSKTFIRLMTQVKNYFALQK